VRPCGRGAVVCVMCGRVRHAACGPSSMRPALWRLSGESECQRATSALLASTRFVRTRSLSPSVHRTSSIRVRLGRTTVAVYRWPARARRAVHVCISVCMQYARRACVALRRACSMFTRFSVICGAVILRELCTLGGDSKWATRCSVVCGSSRPPTRQGEISLREPRGKRRPHVTPGDGRWLSVDSTTAHPSAQVFAQSTWK
jgi:hypothetical protein